MKLPYHKNMPLWDVTLTNGERFIEGIKPFHFISGDRLPFYRLKKYIEEKNTAIESLSLMIGTTLITLPNAKNKPLFREFQGIEVPKEYNCFIKIGVEDKKMDEYKVIEAVYENYKLQIWADAHGNCFLLKI